MSEVNGPKFSVNQVNFNGIQQKPQAEVPVEEPAAEAPKLMIFLTLKLKHSAAQCCLKVQMTLIMI